MNMPDPPAGQAASASRRDPAEGALDAAATMTPSTSGPASAQNAAEGEPESDGSDRGPTEQSGTQPRTAAAGISVGSGSVSQSPGHFLDRLLPGPGSPLDTVSHRLQEALAATTDTSVGRPILELLRGDRWLGHPAHPVVVTVPVGAWVVSSWFDLKSTRTGRPRDNYAADVSLRIGIVGAALAAVTGIAQFVDTRDQTRRETAVHSGLNNVARILYLLSLGLRRNGKRKLGRRVSAAALAMVGVSGYLGGDLAYRHGVGVALP